VTTPCTDLAAFTALARLTGLALSPDGRRLVSVVQTPDSAGAKYISALWEIDPGGVEPARRLTWSDKGESAPSFRSDGALMFLSARATPDGDDDFALWILPDGEEARPLIQRPGGVRSVTATRSGDLFFMASQLIGSSSGDADIARRAERKDRRIGAILHTGMPIRSWDHELGDTCAQLLHRRPDGSLLELVTGSHPQLPIPGYSVSADGLTVALARLARTVHGQFPSRVLVIDVDSGARRVLADEDGVSYGDPTMSPDGSRVVVVRTVDGDFDTPMTVTALSYDIAGEHDPVLLHLGDVEPGEVAWAADSLTLFVSGDHHGRGAVLALNPDTGALIHRLAGDAVYSSLCPSPDGRFLFALRSAIDSPPTPVRLDCHVTDQVPIVLLSPASVPELSGSLHELSVDVAGGTVRGWLCTPAATEVPAPLLVWIHGGPFSSWNSWSWRWNPWVAVARGYAVLLPDPALSTGYGQSWIDRAWPHRAASVWADIEGLLDAAIQRRDIDGQRTACLGASFGGYMTNWIAGHTDRFHAIVTHAGPWALDQQHATTDAANWKSRLFGLPSQHPDWYAENSPHHFIDAISTPMLVSHGNRDYRVPISEALRLWWDLVSHFDGPAKDLPHRFLQFTNENHWILSPANAQVWYETVLNFCDQHVRQQPQLRSPLL
jgi:dipeptidyl aminopeptidase/acylaminoacyl peptidase